MTAEEAVEWERTYKEHYDIYPFNARFDPVEAPFPYSGYIRPFHFKHPVIGKETKEGAGTLALKKKQRATK